MKAGRSWRLHTETPSERRVRKALENAGIPFEQESRIDAYVVDFRVGDTIVIEVDGFFHCTQAAHASDEARDRRLQELGYIVFRVTNDEIKSAPCLERLTSRIRRELETQQSQTNAAPLQATLLDHPRLLALKTQLEHEQNCESRTLGDGRGSESRRRRLTDRELFEKWVREMSDAPDDR